MSIKAYLIEKGLSINSLAKATGIPYATLHNNIERPETMRVQTLKIVSDYLSESMDDVFAMFENQVESIVNVLKEQKNIGLKGNLYHKTQIEFAYNSNRIEGSQLSEDETRYIFETNTLLSDSDKINVDDIIEMTNHFALFDYMLETANLLVSEEIIKKYHAVLKRGTSDARLDWFNVGDYKKLPNQVAGLDTTEPQNVHVELAKLLIDYHAIKKIELEDIVHFHYQFERIHPFQDGNGRVGRMIMFKECLKHQIIPFVIQDVDKAFYYRGLSKFEDERGWLIDTCLTMQDHYRLLIDKLLPNIEI